MTRNVKAVALTNERHATHGSFAEVARLTSGFVDVAKTGTSYQRLNETQKMSLKEICHKLSRILAGDPNHKDHWDDVGGYAHLGSNACTVAEAPTLRKARKTKKPKARKPAARAKKKVKARRAAKSRVVRGSRKRPTARVARPRPVAAAPAGQQEAA